MSGFRGGLVIGILVTAVVGLAVAVAILASDGDDNGGGKTSSSTTAAADQRCLIDYGTPPNQAKAELDLRTSDLTCDQATQIHTTLSDEGAIEFAEGFGKATRNQGWACFFQPLAFHPLLEHCSAPGRRFLVLSLAPAAHTADPAPPPFPPPGTSAECGNLVESGAGSYGVKGNGVDCGRARVVAETWEAVCFGVDPGPQSCPVVYGFSCSQTLTGEEISSVQCVDGDRAVTFENGA